MKKKLVFFAFASLILLAASLGSGPQISWYAITGGGDHYTVGIYSLDSNIGQPIVGIQTVASRELCSGFLCVSNANWLVYLPLVRK